MSSKTLLYHINKYFCMLACIITFQDGNERTFCPTLLTLLVRQNNSDVVYNSQFLLFPKVLYCNPEALIVEGVTVRLCKHYR